MLDGCRSSARQTNSAAKKKFTEKAFIPLPPTGLYVLFCASRDVVQMTRHPKRAVGLSSKVGVSQGAKY